MINIFYTALKEKAFDTAELVLKELYNNLSVQELEKKSSILEELDFYSWWNLNYRILERDNINFKWSCYNKKSVLLIDNLYEKTINKIDKKNSIETIFNRIISFEKIGLNERKVLIDLIEENDLNTLKKCTFYDHLTDSNLDIGSFILLNFDPYEVKNLFNALSDKRWEVEDFKYNPLSLSYAGALRKKKYIRFLGKDKLRELDKEFSEELCNLFYSFSDNFDSIFITQATSYNNISIEDVKISIAELDNIDIFEEPPKGEYDSYYKILTTLSDIFDSKETKKILKDYYKKYGNMDLKKNVIDTHILTYHLEKAKQNLEGANHNIKTLNYLVDYPINWASLDKRGHMPLIDLLDFKLNSFGRESGKYINRLNSSDKKRFNNITQSAVDFINSEYGFNALMEKLDQIEQSFLNKETFYLKTNLVALKKVENAFEGMLTVDDKLLNKFYEKIDNIIDIRIQLDFYHKASHCLDLIENLAVFEIPDKYKVDKNINSIDEYHENIHRLKSFFDKQDQQLSHLDINDLDSFSNFYIETKDVSFFKDQKNINTRELESCFISALKSFEDLPRNMQQDIEMKKLYISMFFIAKPNAHLNSKDNEAKVINISSSISNIEEKYENLFQTNLGSALFDFSEIKEKYSDFFDKNKNLIVSSMNKEKYEPIKSFAEKTILEDDTNSSFTKKRRPSL